MKRLFPFLLIALLGLVFITPSSPSWSAGTLKVTTPNGGQKWAAGEKYVIKWNKGNAGSYVLIRLLKSGKHFEWISKNTKNDGRYKWIVPSKLVESNRYQILIRSIVKRDIRDLSDGYFTVTQSFAGDYIGNLKLHLLAHEVGIGRTNWDYITTAEIEVESNNRLRLTVEAQTFKSVIDADGNWAVKWSINSFGPLISDETIKILRNYGCLLGTRFIRIEGRLTPPTMSGDVSGVHQCKVDDVTRGSLRVSGMLTARK